MILTKFRAFVMVLHAAAFITLAIVLKGPAEYFVQNSAHVLDVVFPETGLKSSFAIVLLSILYSGVSITLIWIINSLIYDAWLQEGKQAAYHRKTIINKLRKGKNYLIDAGSYNGSAKSLVGKFEKKIKKCGKGMIVCRRGFGEYLDVFEGSEFDQLFDELQELRHIASNTMMFDHFEKELKEVKRFLILHNSGVYSRKRVNRLVEKINIVLSSDKSSCGNDRFLIQINEIYYEVNLCLERTVLFVDKNESLDKFKRRLRHQVRVLAAMLRGMSIREEEKASRLEVADKLESLCIDYETLVSASEHGKTILKQINDLVANAQDLLAFRDPRHCSPWGDFVAGLRK